MEAILSFRDGEPGARVPGVSADAAARPSVVLAVPSRDRVPRLVRDVAQADGGDGGLRRRRWPSGGSGRRRGGDQRHRARLRRGHGPRGRAAVRGPRAASFRVDVVDSGRGVDPRAVPRVDLERYVTERRKGGLGRPPDGQDHGLRDLPALGAPQRVRAGEAQGEGDGSGRQGRDETPVVFQYQRALDEFRREGREPPLLKRMSELISLLDLTTTLGSALSGGEILDAALLIVMGELQVARGASVRARARRALPPPLDAGQGAEAPETLDLPDPPDRPLAPEASHARLGRGPLRARVPGAEGGPRRSPSSHWAPVPQARGVRPRGDGVRARAWPPARPLRSRTGSSTTSSAG